MFYPGLSDHKINDAVIFCWLNKTIWKIKESCENKIQLFPDKKWMTDVLNIVFTTNQNKAKFIKFI